MKTPAIVLSGLVILFGAASNAAAQGSRPVTPPPANGAEKPAPMPTVTNPPASATAGTDYRLVSGDQLRIEVYKEPQLSHGLQVRPDGKITLPLIGDVPAAGRTAAELRETLETSLKEHLRNPVVTVIVVETMPQTIHVMGEVNAPGPQVMNGDLNIIQALAAAGGFKLFADQDEIKILRKGPKGPTPLMFNYKKAIKGEGEILPLRPGDTIIVK
jgi:polysaccharide biosynthesis/export protein